MKNIIMLLLIVAAYMAGYLTPKNNFIVQESSSPALIAHESSQPAAASPNNSVVNVPADSAATENKKQAKISNTERPDSISPDQKIPSTTQMGFDSGGPAIAAKDAINDEEIDKVVPAPFNKQLKSNHGFIRDRYRKFVDQEQPEDRDRDLYNHLSDAILSNPYAKYLNIESMQCKAGLCEIRLYEQKIGVWSYIQAEMRLQDWWKFSSSSSSGFEVGDKNKQGWYILLTTD